MWKKWCNDPWFSPDQVPGRFFKIDNAIRQYLDNFDDEATEHGADADEVEVVAVIANSDNEAEGNESVTDVVAEAVASEHLFEPLESIIPARRGRKRQRKVEAEKPMPTVLASAQPQRYDDDPVDEHDGCPICFSSLIMYEHGTTTCCKQRIHHSCMQTWINTNKMSPSCVWCRERLNSLNVKRVFATEA